jgi:hypothetical protein
VGDRKGAERIFLEKPIEKRLLGRPRCRWTDNIKKHLQEMGLEFMNWIALA